ncbi:hypothetical protein MP228_009841 [Amoeboaphelidium protococcarum]|nr:hypothetical protein MP228_009841 [Amoeboaphelidium protococcarum]
MATVAPVVSKNLQSWLRWTALGSGLVYGLYHNRALYTEWKKEHDHHVQVESLKKKAEELWDDHVAKETGVVLNPEDPNFDLEKAFAYVTGSQA